MNRLHVRGCARMFVVAMCAMVCHVARSSEADNALIKVDTGWLRGTATSQDRTFLNIPFAQPPIGALRWAAPQLPAAWAGERDATHEAPACPQSAGSLSQRSETEDCLYLNVYAPAPAVSAATTTANLPVIVFVHGGGNVSGAARDFDGRALATRANVLVVTTNYRLGALGWLALPALHDASPTLNFGVQDVQAALKWVQRNIAQFGGDPARVTLSGESAGGVQVWSNLISPGAKGLFHRAIVESANVVGPMSLTPTLDVAYANGQRYAQTLGCPQGPQQLECMRAKPVGEIIDASKTSDDFRQTNSTLWPAVIDKEVIPDWGYNLLKAGSFARMPMLIGANRDEGRLLVALAFQIPTGMAPSEADYQAALKSLTSVAGSGNTGQSAAGIIGGLYTSRHYGSPNNALGAVLTDMLFACPTHTSVQTGSSKTPVYAYEFQDRTAPTAPAGLSGPEKSGAYHSAELLYLFTVKGVPELNAEQKLLSEQMQKYWGNFAATGDPNIGSAGTGLPKWPRFTGLAAPYRALKLGGASGTLTLGAYSSEHQCWFWNLVFGSPKPPVLPASP
jgi:para-nitrobenzyl esterase